MDLVEQLTEHALMTIKKTKHKFFSVSEVQEIIKEKLMDEYTSEIGMAVRHTLIDHDGVDFFKEGDYIHNSKFCYCVGSWFAPKDIYSNPVEAKQKMGMQAWQSHKDDDGYLD